ncbi:MAG: hypothetical protein Q7J76_11245 [Candidatus Brocadiaceae bacterium]|uniref:hypothetical protein n=1 Tax=Candidatus Wunengus sp. YC61 TaxID=3367698 RepID=UPI00271EB776|nr:hypothetical protein [Candidatus Brocadiaceae bacterium]
MVTKTKHKKRLRKKPRVRLLFLILLGSGVIAFVATRFVGCAEYAFFRYNPQYYEPRDLESYEVVKEGEIKTLEKSLEDVGQEKAQKYLKYKDTVKTEEYLEREKRKLQETLKNVEEEERHKTIWEEKQ